MPELPSDNSLVRLVYVSTALQDLTVGGLNDLLLDARRRNGTRGVTGMLLFDQGQFWQVLEGKMSDVMDIYGRIRADRRHYDLVTLEIEAIPERAFADFRMGAIGILTADDDMPIREIMRRANDTSKSAEAQNASRSLLDGFGPEGQWRRKLG